MRLVFAILILCVVALGQEPLVTARVHTNMIPVVQAASAAAARSALGIETGGTGSAGVVALTNIAALVAYSGDITNAQVMGYVAPGDGGESIWRYSGSLPSWTVATNLIVLARSGGGYWVLDGTEINVAACGLVGASMAECSDEVKALLNLADTSDRNLYFPRGTYVFDKRFTATGGGIGTFGHDGVKIRGEDRELTIWRPASTIGNYTNDVYSTLEKVQNAQFTTSGTWTYNAGWAWDASGVARHTPGSTDTLVSATYSGAKPNDKHNWRIGITNRTAGSISVAFGDAPYPVTVSSNGLWVVPNQDTDDSQFPITITPSSDFDGDIDFVSVSTGQAGLNLFEIKDANDISWEGIWFDGYYEAEGVATRIPERSAYGLFQTINDDTSQNWSFKGCKFTGWRHAAVAVNEYGSYGITVEDCHFENVCNDQLNIQGGAIMCGHAGNVRIHRNQFIQCGANYDQSHSIYFDGQGEPTGTRGQLLSDNTFIGALYQKHRTVFIPADGGDWIIGELADVDAPYPRGQPKLAGYAMAVASGNLFDTLRVNLQNGSMIGNNFVNAGIWVPTGQDDMRIIGNVFKYDGTTTNDDMPRIHTGTIANLLISGNVIHSTTGRVGLATTIDASFAILLGAANSNVRVLHNSMRNCQGILAPATSTNLVIDGNVIDCPTWTLGSQGIVRISAYSATRFDNNYIRTHVSGRTLTGPGTTLPFVSFQNNLMIGGAASGVTPTALTAYVGTTYSTNEVARLYAVASQTTNATFAASNEIGGSGNVAAVMADATTAPTTMSTGWLYRDTTIGGNAPYKIYNGTEWVSISPGFLSTASTARAITGVSSTIAADYAMSVLDPSGSYTLSGEPTISDGVLGQRLTIINPTTETQTVTLQDGDVYNLRLGAATRAIGPGDVIVLMFDGSLWCEETFTDN